MKKHLALLASVIVGLTVVTARAQPGGPPGPSWNGAMEKIFGDNSCFTGTMEVHSTMRSGGEMVVSGKISHLEAKTRVEMDMSSMQGGPMGPQRAAQMKQMGMGKMIMISRRDKGLSYMIYPDIKAYAENPIHETNAPPSEFKLEETKLGEETIDGHDCIKSKELVTGPDGATYETTVWKATDFKNFPVKIQMTPKGGGMVMFFKDLKLEKPDSALFEPPADFTKYDSFVSLMMSRVKGARPQ
jgi:hypothetical protein